MISFNYIFFNARDIFHLRNIYCLLFVFLPVLNFAQDLKKIDSLISIIENPEKVCKGNCVKDTVIINVYNKLGDLWTASSPDSGYYYHHLAMEKANRIIKSKNHTAYIKAYAELRKAGAFTGMGWDNYFLGNYSYGLENCKKAIAIANKYKNDKEWKVRVLRIKSNAYNNMASIFQAKGDLPKAITCYFKALRISEETGNLSSQAACNGNLGLLYYNLGKNDEALNYFLRALELNKLAKNSYGEAINYGNLSLVYAARGEIDMAKKYSINCIDLNRAIGNRNDEAIELANLAGIYLNENNFDKALELYQEALEINREIGADYGLTNVTGSIGNLFFMQKKYIEAEKNLKEFLLLAEKLQSKYELLYAHQYLSDLYAATNRYALALEEFQLSILYKDSLVNEENTQSRIQNEVQFKYDKKAAEDSVAHANEKKIKNAEIEKQEAELKANQLQKYFLYGGLALVFVFALFMVNRFIIIRKQKNQLSLSKKIIEEQKQIVEEKHKEITDSINYAERLQRSLMASDILLKQNMSDYFIYFNPKEAVSGDFYWAAELSNKNFILVCADSTGHGVPGAIMSMMNMNSLKETIKEGVSQPDKILNRTREIIIETLANDGSATGGKDGMDCSCLSFDFGRQKLTFSLANNPLWVIRKNEIIEFKPDKMPVGKHDKDSITFKLHEFDLEKDDLILTFTDGYADQFGGEKGKKFKYSNLQKIILENSDKDLQVQKQILSNEFENWMGELEQVDDVCIIGIRI